MRPLHLCLIFITACQFHSAEVLIKSNIEPQRERGKVLIAAYGCAVCHEIKGVSDKPGLIGPPLLGWKSRKYIAGRVVNKNENLIYWIMHPQEVEPGSAMPDLGVTEEEAIDIAAYLNSQ